MCNFPPPPPFFPNHLTNYLKMWAYDGKMWKVLHIS